MNTLLDTAVVKSSICALKFTLVIRKRNFPWQRTVWNKLFEFVHSRLYFWPSIRIHIIVGDWVSELDFRNKHLIDTALDLLHGSYGDIKLDLLIKTIINMLPYY